MSNSQNTVASSGGIGCLTVIGIVFVVLKLLSIPPVASWSWIWVLCPFWINIALLVVMLIAIVLIWLIAR